jgi:solute:Na+ symporter, SSS family
MSPLIILITIICYFLILVAIAQLTGRKADNEAFFLGNKRSPWYVVAFGMVGASLSGVTFISVPGWVGSSEFAYMQMVLGYLLGYIVVANILMPMYYRLSLTSIYTYLDGRFGKTSYRTGASFFLLSRVIGASFRLFLVANVLQFTVFDSWNVPFWVSVIVTILLIWLYTFRGGIKTIIWTDTLQTLFMLAAVLMSVIFIARDMELDFEGVVSTIRDSDYSRWFFFDDWKDKRHFVKQFFSGMFITIVMTGLDQDMMQKNLSCKNIKEAKKNMYWFSITLVPVNLLFLSLGALLFIYASQKGLTIPEQSDNLFPMIASGGYMGPVIAVVFILGLIAAAYSSADSALTALTTSFSVDILNIRKHENEEKRKRIRKLVHAMFSLILFVVILIFNSINNENVISAIFTAAGYTYGPLLGLYAYGLFTKLPSWDQYVPYLAIVSPCLSYLLKLGLAYWFGWQVGFELLILNGLITFFGLWVLYKMMPDQD